MAQAIIRHAVDEATYKVVREKVRDYLRSDTAELQLVETNARSLPGGSARRWGMLATRLTVALEDLVATTDKKTMGERVFKVTNALIEMRDMKAKYARDIKIAEDKLDKSRGEYEEYLTDYLKSTLRSTEVKRALLALPPITYKQPLVGETTVTMEEALKRADFLPTFKAIRANPASVSPIPLDEYGKGIEYPELPPYEGYASIYAAVNHIGEMGLRANPRLESLPRLFESALDIVVDLEVSAPDTSRDALMAEVLGLCPDVNAGNKTRLLGIAAEIGMDVNDLRQRRVKQDELCQLILAAL